eukprot:102606_1
MNGNVCICEYKEEDAQGFAGDLMYCNPSPVKRNNGFLNVEMPMTAPQWMPSSLFKWLNQQRIESFPTLLPLNKVNELNQKHLFSLPPQHVLKILFLQPIYSPAAAAQEDGATHNVLSVYEDDDYYNYEQNEAYESNYRSMMGFTDDNEYYLYWNQEDALGTAIIDTFDGDLDDEHWFITNKFIDMNSDDKGLAADILNQWNAGDEANLFEIDDVFQTTTESNHQIKRRCMILFGKPLCLCEFINGLVDRDGLKPLYQCDTSPFLSGKGGAIKTKHEEKEGESSESSSSASQESEESSESSSSASKESESESESEEVAEEPKEEGKAEEVDEDEDDSPDVTLIVIIIAIVVMILIIIAAGVYIAKSSGGSSSRSAPPPPSSESLFG